MNEPTHTCPGGCGRQVPHHQFACRVDWHRLPGRHQLAISTTYWAGDTQAHSEAMVEAMHWYRSDGAR